MDRRILYLSTTFLMLFGILNCYATSSYPVKLQRDAESIQKAPAPKFLGTSIEISSDPVEIFSAAMGADGIAHIVLSVPESYDLFHYKIDLSGIKNKKVIKRPRLTKFLDTVFDEEGGLHLIVDGTHLVYRKDEWLELEKSPCHLFVKGGRYLTCAQVSKGWDVGAPGKVEWYGFMAAGSMGGGGMIWPWFNFPDKLSIMQYQAGTWSEWTVVDRRSKFELAGFSVAADRKDRIHILYGKSRGGLISMTSAVEYALMDFQSKKVRLLSSESKESAANWYALKSRPKGIIFGGGGSGGFGFVVLPSFRNNREDILNCSIVTNPESGASFVACGFKGSFVDEAGYIGPFKPFPANGILAGTAEAGRFDFLVLRGSRESTFISHVAYENCTCSDPVDLAEAPIGLFSASIISHRDGRVLAVYPMNKKLAAQWIRRNE